MGSGGNRLKKKRKETGDINFDGAEVEFGFNQGKTNEVNTEVKKKIGRKSVTKELNVARKIGVNGLGENKKGSQILIRSITM